jgi:hypothetical protein
MFPFRLFHVRLHLYGLLGEPEEVVATFLRDLQDATLARASDESIPCFGCRESAVQEGTQERSLLQISADVRYNAAPVVITFVIVVAA